GLDDFNRAALASGRPWLLAKPVGSVVWLGPLFRHGQGACWECLAQRLRGNREVATYLQRRSGQVSPFPVSTAAAPASLQVGAGLVATEVARAIGGDTAMLGQSLVTLDLSSLSTERHTVVRRPQCPSCGDGADGPARDPIPLVLQSRPKQFMANGGH